MVPQRLLTALIRLAAMSAAQNPRLARNQVSVAQALADLPNELLWALSDACVVWLAVTTGVDELLGLQFFQPPGDFALTDTTQCSDLRQLLSARHCLPAFPAVDRLRTDAHKISEIRGR